MSSIDNYAHVCCWIWGAKWEALFKIEFWIPIHSKIPRFAQDSGDLSLQKTMWLSGNYSLKNI